MENRILVAYATGSGSTREVAEAIGEELEGEDVGAEVRNVSETIPVHSYSAVVLGSSIRLGRWLPDAIRFLKEHRDDLQAIPVAYFTTCLAMAEGTEEARRRVMGYIEPVLNMAPEIEPVGLGLFAGSLDPVRQLSEPFKSGPYGDYRDWDTIRAWAREIRTELLAGPRRKSKPMVLTGAILSYTDMSRTDLSRFDLRRTKLEAAKLRKSKLLDADLREAKLYKADLHEADLRDANLSWADLRDSNLNRANLYDANLIGANLKGADLNGADLRYAILNGAVLANANLDKTQLNKSDLQWADLSGAQLQGADLREANLGWANLQDADLTNANLMEAKYNNQTVWPTGYNPEEAGCILFKEPL